jgi:D-alanine-D-alanine ligase
MKNGYSSGKPPQRRPKNGGRSTQKALGPVENLESHVLPDWWRWIFNPLYLKTDADVVADDRITSSEVDVLLDVIQPDPDAHILDLCCGQGRHTLEFARRGFQFIEGLDRSHYLIQKARKHARSRGLEVRFREGDARKLPHAADSFDVVMILGNSFGYFETVEDDVSVLREVLRILKPGGKLVLDITDGDYLKANYQPRSWEWADKRLFVCRERALSSDGQRLITREIINHTEKGVIADQFYSERLYDGEGIAALVEEAGFSNILQHEGFTPNSQRNQDLGMMAQRILLTCIAEKHIASGTRIAPAPLRNVVVVMGDPRKRDEVKPASIFDEDDFYTIEQLQAALANLTNRQFAYLDHHDNLVEELCRSDREIDLVLNLCDEGFDNDPRKELHVPAVLEMLHIPFTGAGPQCLAFCYDKSLVRGVAKEMGIAVPEGLLVKAGDTAFDLPMPFPVIVKPNFGDSSFGIIQRSVVHNPEELLDAIAEVRSRFGYEKPILVEELLTGQDLTVGILGNPPEDYNVLPILEEDYSMLPEGLPHICGYEAKWLPDSPYWNLCSIPAELPEDVRNLIVDACVKLFVRLECRDYCRFDWRVASDGQPKLLEVNPNPGWCWDGHLAKMAGFAGMSYADLLNAILMAAERRLQSDKGMRSSSTIGSGNGRVNQREFALAIMHSEAI